MEPIRIDYSEISPKLLRAVYFNSMKPNSGRILPRYAYDYELKLFVEGNGSFTIDSTNHKVSGANIAFIKPGQNMQGVAPYTAYTISFDITGNSRSSKNKQLNYDIHEKQDIQPIYINNLIDKIPQFFSTIDISTYLALFKNIYTHTINPRITSQIVIKSSILSLLSLIYDESNHLDVYPASINKSIRYINESLDKNISIKSIAKSCNLSPTYFQSSFKKHIKMTPNAYITNARLEKAKEMLAHSDIPICEITFLCGFTSPAYFDFVFKKHIKISPTQFRNRFQN